MKKILLILLSLFSVSCVISYPNYKGHDSSTIEGSHGETRYFGNRNGIAARAIYINSIDNVETGAISGISFDDSKYTVKSGKHRLLIHVATETWKRAAQKITVNLLPSKKYILKAYLPKKGSKVLFDSDYVRVELLDISNNSVVKTYQIKQFEATVLRERCGLIYGNPIPCYIKMFK